MSALADRPLGRSSPFQRDSLVTWVVLALTAYGLYALGTQLVDGVDKAPGATVVALAIWIVFLALFLWLLVSLQLFERRPLVSVLAAVSWGGFVATSAAISANAAVQELLTRAGGPLVIENWGPALAAPFDEESLKVLGVIALVLLPLTAVRSTLDGLFYGMLVGLGFQVVEDYLYSLNAAIASNSVHGVVTSFVTRGLLTGLFSHAMYTGITGAGIGYAASCSDKPWSRRIGVAALLFLAAVFFHFFWDSPLVTQQIGSPFGSIVGIFVKGIPTFVFLLLLVRWARRQERRDFERFSATRVDPGLISEPERADLMSWRSRRRARRAQTKRHGREARRSTKRLQHAQLDLVQSISEQGPESPAAEEAARSVGQARARLAALPSRG